METGNQIELNNKVEKFIALLLFACADWIHSAAQERKARLKRSSTMFPLSCARAHTSCETSAHKKTWSAHNCPFLKCLHIISYTSFHKQMSPGKMLHKRNFMRTETFKN